MGNSVIDILEELEATAGKNARRDILELNKKNDLLKRMFIAAQDPYTVYYVSKFKMPKAQAAATLNNDAALELFINIITNQLATRKVTGNAAKELIETFMGSVNAVQQKWCQRILLKNLRAGVQSTVLDVWPGLIKSFDVALAETLKSDFVKGVGIKILGEVTYPVRVEPKLDGLRCIAIKRDGKVTFWTRNGTELDSMPKIKAVLEKAKFDNVVLDGEGMAADWNESASVMMSKTQKDDSNLFYNVFDAMPVIDWDKQECEMPYRDRAILVRNIVEICQSTHVRQVTHIMAKNEDELRAYFAKCMDTGFEGVMLKTLNTPYEFKRSKNILKLKPCVTYEGVIVGHYEGRRGTKREGLFGGFEVVLPSGAVTRVGGGFNDALKAEIQLNGPETYLGKIVEIEAQPDPMTKDGLTVDGKARFPVYTRQRPEADVDPKVIAAGVAYFENINQA